MFRKIVSGLPYSPALVGQLGFYARRLRQEEATRRLGLLFTALALVMQSFAVFSPPELANAANDSDFIRGGVKSLDDILAVYDQSSRGKGDFKNIMDYAGITREEIAATKSSSINSKQFGTGSSAALSWGRVPRFSSSEGEVRHNIPFGDDVSTVYSRPLWRYDSQAHTIKKGSKYEAYVGHSAKIGWFAILKDCANLVTIKTPQPTPSGAVTVSCTTVSGYAYDARLLTKKVKVYLYYGGPAGKGQRIGPLDASNDSINSPVGKGYGFSHDIPKEFKTPGKPPVQVYAVMIPHSGWNESSVQLGVIQIPTNCTEPAAKPNAACEGIQIKRIDRTTYSFTATASSSDGAKLNGYSFIVKDKTGKVVSNERLETHARIVDSQNVSIKPAGDYTISAIAHTSLGDKSSSNCQTILTVSEPELCPYTPTLSQSDNDCSPCPGDSSIWIKDDRCNPDIINGKEVKNLTHNTADANYTTVRSGDRIEYTIYAENVGLLTAEISMTEHLSDVLEYATVVDNGGGQYDSSDKTLSWGTLQLQPNEKQIRKFVVQIHNSIAATPQGQSEPGSYDCLMTNTFGNSTTLYVDCPPVKVVESTINQLPKTGSTTNVIFGSILASVVTYFYVRSKQMSKEIRLIRRDFNSGTI